MKREREKQRKRETNDSFFLLFDEPNRQQTKTNHQNPLSAALFVFVFVFMKSILILILVVIIVAVNGVDVYHNPVVDDDCPDPGVLHQTTINNNKMKMMKSETTTTTTEEEEEEDEFWMVTTTTGDLPAFPIRHSTDLVNW